jgi:hypothetical protein
VVLKEHYAGDPDLFWVLKDYDLRLRRFAPGELDLVSMGDSCTEFSDHPRLLVERLSADHPEREIVGLKLAVGGWSSFQGLQQMRRDVVSLRPKVVTVQYRRGSYGERGRAGSPDRSRRGTAAVPIGSP